MKQRGLIGIKLVISDKCLGLVESANEHFSDAYWQRCCVHWHRNIFTNVPRKKMREVAAMLKAIHAQEDRQEAQKKAKAVVDKLADMKLKKAAELVRGGAQETLEYYYFSPEHWRSLRTNNPLERIMREIRRRSRIVGYFPDGRSALILATARLRHITGTRWGMKKYMNMKRLQEQKAELLVAG